MITAWPRSLPGIIITMLRSLGAAWFFAQPAIHGNPKSVIH